MSTVSLYAQSHPRRRLTANYSTADWAWFWQRMAFIAQSGQLRPVFGELLAELADAATNPRRRRLNHGFVGKISVVLTLLAGSSKLKLDTRNRRRFAEIFAGVYAVFAYAGNVHAITFERNAP